MMSPLPLSDAQDVLRSLEGDREAFGRLYDRHGRAVRAVVVAVSGDFDSVEDLTQETFLRGYRGLATLRDAKKFGRWIRGVARTVARERKRDLGRDRQRLGMDAELVAANVDINDPIVRHEEQRRVLDAVAELPLRERLVIHAYYFQEQSGEQAASTMGMSRSGFYAVLTRGMKRLRKRLHANSPTRGNKHETM